MDAFLPASLATSRRCGGTGNSRGVSRRSAMFDENQHTPALALRNNKRGF
jgi:hypothetical protein